MLVGAFFVVLGAGFFLDAGLLALAGPLVTRPDLVLPRTFFSSTTAGAWICIGGFGSAWRSLVTRWGREGGGKGLAYGGGSLALALGAGVGGGFGLRGCRLGGGLGGGLLGTRLLLCCSCACLLRCGCFLRGGSLGFLCGGGLLGRGRGGWLSAVAFLLSRLAAVLAADCGFAAAGAGAVSAGSFLASFTVPEGPVVMVLEMWCLR